MFFPPDIEAKKAVTVVPILAPATKPIPPIKVNEEEFWYKVCAIVTVAVDDCIIPVIANANKQVNQEFVPTLEIIFEKISCFVIVCIPKPSIFKPTNNRPKEVIIKATFDFALSFINK